VDVDESCLQGMKKEMAIYAARPNAFSKTFINVAMACGFTISRIDARVGFAAEMNLVIGTRRLIDSMGTMEIEGIPVVSGGLIGPKGSIVVDSLVNPTMVIGIADGLGGLLTPEEEAHHKNAIERVEVSILENIFHKRY